jgi:SAM-dependent methyltransferase
MAFYQDQVLPFLIRLSMRDKTLAAYRARLVGAAEGRVLEIGIGSGLNLPFYAANVKQLIGLEPSPKLLGMARKAARRTSTAVEFLEGSSEQIPLADKSVDTIVTTWTLCTVPDASRALEEVRRVVAGKPPEKEEKRRENRFLLHADDAFEQDVAVPVRLLGMHDRDVELFRQGLPRQRHGEYDAYRSGVS